MELQRGQSLLRCRVVDIRAVRLCRVGRPILCSRVAYKEVGVDKQIIVTIKQAIQAPSSYCCGTEKYYLFEEKVEYCDYQNG